MPGLTDQDRERIRAAIRDAESRTSGEIVTVIARRGDDYAFIPVLWAALLALASPTAVITAWPGMTADVVYVVQGAVFLLAYLALLWPPLRIRAIPRAVRRHRARRMAFEQFLAQGVHRTAERTGVLIFVAFAERHVEVIADAGINAKVTQADWDGVVAAFTGRMKRGEVGDAFVEAVSRCGSLLETHFPRPPGNPDELPDHLVEL